MTITAGGTGAARCGYCGNWHTHSPELCRDMHRNPPAPASSGVFTGNFFTQDYVDKMKADHLAEIAKKTSLIETLQEEILALDTSQGVLTKSHNKWFDEAEKLSGENAVLNEQLTAALDSINHYNETANILITERENRIKELEGYSEIDHKTIHTQQERIKELEAEANRNMEELCEARARIEELKMEIRICLSGGSSQNRMEQALKEKV